MRQATLADVSILEYWDTQPHVMDSDPKGDWNWEKELAQEPFWRSQWIAELEGHPIGMVQIIDPHFEETHYWGEIGLGYRAIDIWIGEEKHIGKGYGTQMMVYALGYCFQSPDVHTVLIDPLETNTKAIRFYKRLGFEWLENRVFDGDACQVLKITRDRFFSLHILSQKLT